MANFDIYYKFRLMADFDFYYKFRLIANFDFYYKFDESEKATPLISGIYVKQRDKASEI